MVTKQNTAPTSITLLLITLAALPVASFADFSFIALGDTPYTEEEEQVLRETVVPAIRALQTPFVVHYGDFKDGGANCTNTLFQARRKSILGIIPDRVFYTPGDNDWTDCDRDYIEEPVSELERLDYLRRLFFSEPPDLPSSFAYQRQDNFPENARWQFQNVVFATLHWVATNNGRQEILLDDIEAALALVAARDQANRVWLEQTFSVANKKKADAIVLVTQADVTRPGGSGDCSTVNKMNCDAFASFRSDLKRLSRDFTNDSDQRRPVLLIHGDTTPYCMDSKFGGDIAPNLYRLNAWGDFKEPADATVVSVNPGSNRPFTARTLMGRKRPDKRCN